MKKLLKNLQDKINADGIKKGVKTNLLQEYLNKETGEVVYAKNMFLAKIYFKADGIIHGYKVSSKDVIFNCYYVNDDSLLNE